MPSKRLSRIPYSAIPVQFGLSSHIERLKLLTYFKFYSFFSLHLIVWNELEYYLRIIRVIRESVFFTALLNLAQISCHLLSVWFASRVYINYRSAHQIFVIMRITLGLPLHDNLSHFTFRHFLQFYSFISIYMFVIYFDCDDWLTFWPTLALLIFLANKATSFVFFIVPCSWNGKTDKLVNGIRYWMDRLTELLLCVSWLPLTLYST